MEQQTLLLPDTERLPPFWEHGRILRHFIGSAATGYCAPSTVVTQYFLLLLVSYSPVLCDIENRKQPLGAREFLLFPESAINGPSFIILRVAFPASSYSPAVLSR